MGSPTSEDPLTAVVKTEGVLDGKPRLDGYRIGVLDVTELLEAGYSIPETADQLAITPEEVRAASRYFRRHRDEMVELRRRRREGHEELRRSA